VFDHYLRHEHYLISLQIIFSSRRRQRRRQQQHHFSTMWCISELDFMMISLRAKSKRNYLQNSSQLRLLRKCTFASFMSCDTNLTKKYKTRLVKHVMCHWSCDQKTRKVHLRSKCNCDEFWRKFISDFARSKIIIKSSSEIHDIVDEWCCCYRRRWRGRDEKVKNKIEGGIK
jgi:hypothetical protein